MSFRRVEPSIDDLEHRVDEVQRACESHDLERAATLAASVTRNLELHFVDRSNPGALPDRHRLMVERLDELVRENDLSSALSDTPGERG
ncbi:MAG TPA: hypothetical protein VMT85_06625 [Thermoanaerobaculia bacterium]|nr:hypothetical protein [Thermoanaerobaculia bacterium]